MDDQIAPRSRPENDLVNWFSLRMLRKFAAKRLKDPKANELFWHHYQEGQVDIEWLFLRLQDEMGELARAFLREPLEAAIDEAADVGNLAAMIAGRLQQMKVERDSGADVVPVNG